MDDLTWTLKQLCRRNRDGSFATQADRQRSLTLMARQLRDAGFNQMQARSLKGKHVDALLNQWQAQGLSTGTLKNRLSHLRWWAEKIGKGGFCLPTTASSAFLSASTAPTRVRHRPWTSAWRPSAMRMCR